VIITRRAFCEGTAALGLAAALTGLSAPLAFAQTVSNADLMKAGPLPEMVLGAENAPVTIVEYASMTCSHCATFHVQTYPKLKQQYIDTGKVRFIFREFPLDALAAGAFMLARCGAGNENKDRYFALVDTLFHQQKEWVVQKPLPPLQRIAKQAGITDQAFEQCLANQELLTGIEQVRQQGEKLGVSSTPTFFINGKIQRGALTMEQIEKEIQPYLKG
jgi:protein-disulfide isomerase